MAVMLSNETGDHAVRQKAVVTMGDTLGRRVLTGSRAASAQGVSCICLPRRSLQGPHPRRPRVLRGGRRSLRGVHAAGGAGGPPRQQPQVSSRVACDVFVPSRVFTPLTPSSRQNFRAFSSSAAIQCTELLEYCQTLGGRRPFIPSFQVDLHEGRGASSDP